MSITTPGFVVLSRNGDRKQEIHDVFSWGFNNIFISTRGRYEFALNRLASATDPSFPMIKRFLKASQGSQECRLISLQAPALEYQSDRAAFCCYLEKINWHFVPPPSCQTDMMNTTGSCTGSGVRAEPHPNAEDTTDPTAFKLQAETEGR